MDSDVILSLYDTKNGGKARAFECLLPGKNVLKHCGAVTRTLRGMRSHQHLVHAFTAQPKIFKEETNDGNQAEQH